MKNLTRVLVLALVFSMLLSSVAFGATFTDVEDGTAIAEATDVLAALEILKGDPEGTFRPNDVITRAEVVAVANRLQGLSSAAQAAAGSSIYTDVAADAWYAGDVNLATQMGIIAGDGNGLFRPNDSVKYEEAVKIMVKALGYQDNYVNAKGGWPTGYLVIASEANVTKGLNGTAGQDAYRGVVARLAYNSLNAPMFVQKGYNSDGTFQYGTDVTAQLAYDKLGALKVDLEINDNAATTTTLKTGEFKATIVGHYNEYDGNLVKYAASNGEFTFVTGSQKYLKGNTNIDEFVGYTVTAFVEENDEGNWVVKAFTIPANKNTSVEIADATKIQLTTATKYPSTTGALSVYDEDVDTTNALYDLSETPAIYVNGVKKTGATIDADVAGKVGSVTLLDNGNDGAFDYIFVTTYVTDVVTEVYGQNKKIGMTNDVIDLTNAIEGKKGYSYSLTLDGADIEVADLQEDDVLSYSVDAGKKNYKILVSRETVSGVIEEADVYATSQLKWVYVVDGEGYGLANINASNIASAVGINSVEPGDEGKLYIDAFGKIAMFEKTSASSSNYAFIVAMGEYENVGETTYEIQLFTKDAELVTYTLSEKLKVNGTKATNAAASYAAVLAEIGTADVAVDADSNPIANIGLYDDATTADYADRLVTYTVNSQGIVTALDFAGSDPEFNKVVPSSTVQYSAKTGSFGVNGVTDNTVIFNIPTAAGTTKEDLAISAASSLAEDTDYSLAFFAIDEDTDEIGAMLLTNAPVVIGEDQNLAVFLKAMKASNAEGDDVYKVTFLQAGEEVTITTDVDCDDKEDFVDATVFAKGDLFAYSTNAAGDMDKYEIIANIADLDGTSPAYGEKVDIDVDDAQYEFAFVTDKNATAKTLTLGTIASVASGVATMDGYAWKRAIDENAAFTVIDLNKSVSSTLRVQAGSFAEIQKLALVGGKLADEDRDVAVFLKYYDGDVIDVIIVKGLAANNFGVALAE